jgi:hypothetical protein
VETRNNKFRFQKFWCRPKHPCTHAHLLQTKVAMEGCRKVQLVLLFDKCHYVTQACKKDKRKRKEKIKEG